jgi:hypothetical protein
MPPEPDKLAARLQPGCAESAIVDGILDLMAESNA